MRNFRHFITFSYAAIRTRHKLGRVRLLLLYWGYCLRGWTGGAAQVGLGPLRVNTPNFKHFIGLFEEIFLNRCYFFDCDNPAPRIIDAGANIGMASCYFKTLFPGARIDAFEADKNTSDTLRATFEINGWKDCRVFPCAVSETDGEITFYSRKDETASSYNSTVAARVNKSEFTEQTVQAVRLSSYIDGPIDLLKLDVEGAEMGVMRELVSSRKLAQIEQLFIEYHHHIDKTVDELGHFLGLLENNGFGYVVTSWLNLPTWRGRFQDVVIYAYRK